LHHKNVIDISQIPRIAFLYNYVVGPAQWLADDKKGKDSGLYRINPNIKLLATSKWFLKNIETENKFEKLRKLNLPTSVIESPVSASYDKKKTESKVIRINRHSMSFAYKHDQKNMEIVKKLCDKYGDKISFSWMGVPSQVRNIESKDKNDKVPYASVLKENKQMKIIEAYSKPVPDLLQETDILFFYISRFRKEPWPRTIAEGMMAGCCCVTNNNYGMVEQIDSGKNGYLFDDSDQAYEQLCDLIDHPEKIKQMGDLAQEFAKENFLSEKVTEKMLKFICD